ncbi:MAG: glycolate oxidase subunit GlcE [Candidatus Thiodiazotropha taylori]
MSGDQDQSSQLQANIKDAIAEGSSLRLMGSGSKDFYGRELGQQRVLDLSGNRGIVSYEPTELVITARGGTPLDEIEAALEANGQMLPFEPPHFDGKGTIGGAIAAGLSGPRRPWGGSPRDLLLGIKLLDGQGRIMSFGGQVMKNVAGYDISRLMAGAMGTLGILLEVSIKVLPKPAEEHTLIIDRDQHSATRLIGQMIAESQPLTASYSLADKQAIRLACNHQRLAAIRQKYGLQESTESSGFWQQLRDHKHDFFQQPKTLWRLSLKPTTPLELTEACLQEWSGGLRWLYSERPETELRSLVERQGGHAVQFRNGDRSGDIFHPLHPRILGIQQGLKAVFDPHGLFNPGRHYSDY